MFLKRWEKIVIPLVVVVGLLFTFLVPPFQKPDEIDHFYKSAGLLNLRNCSLPGLCVEKRFYDLPKKTQAEVQRWDYSKKFDFRLLLFKDQSKLVMSYPANFSWQSNALAYVFSAFGVWLGSFSANSLVALYFGRIFNFCFFLTCLLVAIEIIPTGYKKIILFFVSLPMVLHQVTAVSHDAVWLALSLVVFSWWLKIWEQDQIKFKEYLFFVLTVLVFAFVRYGNWFLFLLPVLVPYKKVDRKIYRAVLGFWVVLLLLAIVGGGMFWRKIGLLGLPGSGNFYGLQSDILIKHPLSFLRLILDSFAKNSRFYFEGLVGRFGWLDYGLGYGIYIVYVLFFGLTLKSVVRQVRPRLDWRPLLGLFLVLMMTVLGVFVGMYLYEGLPGQESILLQGRYFLVLVPFLVYFLVAVWQKLELRGWVFGLFLALVVVLNILGEIKNRYYDYSSWIEADDYLKVRGASYFDTPEDMRQDKQYVVDEKFSYNFGLKESGGKFLGFEFVFSSNEQPVNIPYQFRIADKDCKKNFLTGFLDQEQLGEEGVYRHQFKSVKKLSVDEVCLVLEPYFKDEKTNFLRVVEEQGEIYIRLLRPRKKMLEEFGLEKGTGNLGAINKKTEFYQTFEANFSDLMGIGFLVNSFGVKRDVSAYRLQLYDAGCVNLIESLPIDRRKLSHFYFADVFFDPLVESEGKQYCFSVTTSEEGPQYPISLYLVKPRDGVLRRGSYEAGSLRVGGKEIDSDVVFRLWYKN